MRRVFVTMKGLTLFLSHFLQTEVDDSGSQAEPNQGDRSPALRGNRTQASGEVTACQSLHGLQTPPPPNSCSCVQHPGSHTLKCQSVVSGSLHMQELAAMELASSRAGGLWLGWANSLSSQAIINHGSPSQLDRMSQ